MIDGRDPDRWRLDALGTYVMKKAKRRGSIYAFEYDHKVAFAKGGESTLENC